MKPGDAYLLPVATCAWRCRLYGRCFCYAWVLSYCIALHEYGISFSYRWVKYKGTVYQLCSVYTSSYHLTVLTPATTLPQSTYNMVGTVIADKWNKHFYDKMDEEHASSTVPLPGEYIIVERNYYILGDRLRKDPELREELKAELTSEPHKKYCAVVYKVR